MAETWQSATAGWASSAQPPAKSVEAPWSPALPAMRYGAAYDVAVSATAGAGSGSEATEGEQAMGEIPDAEPEAQMHWELAKLFWDGAEQGARRQVWFSHRNPVDFGPNDYDDVLWRLGETGFEPVGYQAFPRSDAKDAAGGWGPAASGLREVTLFKRALGTAPPPEHH